jgi:hypothetical protein
MKIVLIAFLGLFMSMQNSQAQDKKTSTSSGTFQQIADKKTSERGQITEASTSTPPQVAAGTKSTTANPLLRPTLAPKNKDQRPFPKEAYEFLGLEVGCNVLIYKAAKQKLYEQDKERLQQLLQLEKRYLAQNTPVKISRTYLNTLSEERIAKIRMHPERYQIVD